ncbi:tRNA uridine-5-carboxymethylaminomethyl(34) synthesis enzyme MnmG [Anaerofilum sp. BX8]|uniref:tRNA uridine 5-carboxymethylaminomethyl modification enzyme MnmG n=1 Tax=Anaerofilum hominis TaxID=2763016 RepID=A0A923REI4_9FIRM|nr:tRNA uridine-5-carboxymethylaminomethyl(34) synthesis enzyme MnmG [Anaerofilum hominis]MBC5582315.1 tRNA uridine-5-carboxymethylaminomethyl(34) synthesis enzyme MnmG [Anaerofilum hominis]
MDLLGSYDVIVVGAGHAGIEAAVAAARLGCRTALFTMSLDGVGNMPCNPSIGGTAKGHLVREIDALGGVMGLAADATFLQSRMLNRGKGPAVHSLRVQSDRQRYHEYMKRLLERTQNLELKQGEVVRLLSEDGRVTGVETRLCAGYRAGAVILATGTYLAGKIYVGEASYESGPDGQHAALGLSDSLRALGVSLRRFKTGTPARANRRSIDFSALEVQPGDEPVEPFSFMTRGDLRNKVVCHITYTNEQTHRIILDNIGRSPLYGGKIEGVGPRYCPSIEDKVMRFRDKPRHQIFIEPCGEDTDEMYLQGMSSSLPEEVQNAFYHTIRGLEQLEIMRPAYAIEYDCCDPLELDASLAFKRIPGLFGAGQFNGTSGYEEAAAQGLVAGINAARTVQGKEPVILERQSSYIGTLIDDLVTKGVLDPYRMMTSRSEYRLTLRQDNADERLTPLGRELGLVDDARWTSFQRDQAVKQQELKRLAGRVLRPSEAAPMLEQLGEPALVTGATALELLRRPAVSYAALVQVIGPGEGVGGRVAAQIETEVKYEGYIRRQQQKIEALARQEKVKIPPELDYGPIEGIRLEAREKLSKVRPKNLGQAARIPGVSPSDIAVLSVELAARRARDGKGKRS